MLNGFMGFFQALGRTRRMRKHLQSITGHSKLGTTLTANLLEEWAGSDGFGNDPPIATVSVLSSISADERDGPSPLRRSLSPPINWAIPKCHSEV
jgi:hypothetical protein